ncbi:hypothetical protein KC19_6G084100 [Ceratodon purpureus]|uniref:Uncharacterized protein n=1 Tax=Ceratodon purpureus TaxID=3225 RepID=A0A8T0HBY1_CERPU|nr:hypothetical protein KC19_6G084100 [Ceratodon purpureus]
MKAAHMIIKNMFRRWYCCWFRRIYFRPNWLLGFRMVCLVVRMHLLTDFVGAGWGPGQLEQEVEATVWYLTSCSKRFVLNQCIQLPKPLWNEVMEHMGPPYSDILRRAK